MHVDPPPTAPLPCDVCSHCTKEVYDTFEKELAVYEAMIQKLDEENQKFRDDEKKFVEEIEKQKAKENQNLEYIQELEKELANFLARIQNLEDQNNKLKEDKNKLHAKIQDLEAENEQNIKDLRGELVVFLERIQQLEDDNKNLREEKDKLLDKVEELKAQSILQTVQELLDKNRELEKKCEKPSCSNNTGCPSWQACVRYFPFLQNIFKCPQFSTKCVDPCAHFTACGAGGECRVAAHKAACHCKPSFAGQPPHCR